MLITLEAAKGALVLALFTEGGKNPSFWLFVVRLRKDTWIQRQDITTTTAESSKTFLKFSSEVSQQFRWF